MRAPFESYPDAAFDRVFALNVKGVFHLTRACMPLLEKASKPGDPARAAQAIISAVEAPDPPFLLLLGADALQGFNAVLEAQRKELESWESLTLSTGFPT